MPLDNLNNLMFITHRTAAYTELDETRMVIQGGCSWIQLRMKEAMSREMAQACAETCANEQGRDINFCVNDNLPIALDCGASACHLGKEDIAVDMAWETIRNTPHSSIRYIGATANTFEEIQAAVDRGASYIGLGPFRFTDTKKKLSPVLGTEGYRKIMERCTESGINIPIFAIGGIALPDVKSLMRTGIAGIAISGAIINAPDPVEETRRFIEEINRYKTI